MASSTHDAETVERLKAGDPAFVVVPRGGRQSDNISCVYLFAQVTSDGHGFQYQIPRDVFEQTTPNTSMTVWYSYSDGNLSGRGVAAGNRVVRYLTPQEDAASKASWWMRGVTGKNAQIDRAIATYEADPDARRRLEGQYQALNPYLHALITVKREKLGRAYEATHMSFDLEIAYSATTLVNRVAVEQPNGSTRQRVRRLQRLRRHDNDQIAAATGQDFELGPEERSFAFHLAEMVLTDPTRIVEAGIGFDDSPEANVDRLLPGFLLRGGMVPSTEPVLPPPPGRLEYKNRRFELS